MKPHKLTKEWIQLKNTFQFGDQNMDVSFLREHRWSHIVDGWIFRDPGDPISKEDIWAYQNYGEKDANEALQSKTTN